MPTRLRIHTARVVRWIPRRLSLIALLFASSSCDLYPLPSGPESSGRGTIEDQVAVLVNDYRQSIGCRRLVWNSELAEVARRHSADMLSRSYFGHEDPDGKDLRYRLRSAGVRFSLAGENIAQGFRYADAAKAVFEGWLNTEGHRKIIETCAFSEHGVGFVDYRWTHIFLK